MAKIIVQGSDISVLTLEERDYISLTDIARYKSDDPTSVIVNWMRNRNTISILVFRKRYIILFLNPSNSRGLKRKQGLMRLHFPLRNG